MTPVRSAVLRGAGWVDAGGPGSPAGGRPFRLGVEPLPPIRWQQVSDAPNPRFGRLDPFTRTGLLAVATALKAAGLAETGGARRPLGIVASSDLGCLATDLDYYDTVLPADGALASPNRFVYTLPSCFLGEAAIIFGLTGPGFVVNPGPKEPLAALGLALDWLASGECPAMLAGFCDVPPAEPAVAGVPAGAGFVLLERAPHPSQRGSEASLQAGRAFREELSLGDTPIAPYGSPVPASKAEASCPHFPFHPTQQGGSGASPQAGRAFREELPLGDTPIVPYGSPVSASKAEASCPPFPVYSTPQGGSGASSQAGRAFREELSPGDTPIVPYGSPVPASKAEASCPPFPVYSTPQGGSGASPQAGRAFREELPLGDTPIVPYGSPVPAPKPQASCPPAERPRSLPYPTNILTCQNEIWLLNNTPIHTWADLFAVLCARPTLSGDTP